MIVFDLCCTPHGHRFEGWFRSSADFAAQQERGLVTCPDCGSAQVGKAVMAPNVGRKGNQLPAARPAQPQPPARPAEAVTNAAPTPSPEAIAMFRALAQAQAEALKQSRWVGGDFAENARAIHYGEKDAEVIHGQATADEARELIEEGVEIAPILFPVVPPDQAN